MRAFRLYGDEHVIPIRAGDAIATQMTQLVMLGMPTSALCEPHTFKMPVVNGMVREGVGQIAN